MRAEGYTYELSPLDVGKEDYRDTGCRHAPACLSCPFPQCKEDFTRENVVESPIFRENRFRRAQERADTHAKYMEEGLNNWDAALAAAEDHGCSRQTIWRAVRLLKKEEG